MTFFQALILGLVQGFTEFLPISSSGHLVFFEKLFNITNENLAFNIAVHIGSLIAVIICYRKQIWELIKHPFSKKACFIYVATIPTIIIVLLFKKYIESSFGNNFFILGFAITALLLLISQFILQKYKKHSSLSYGKSIVVGIAQGIATMPGISRSGTTITAGVITGLSSEDATEFSFLLSIPIIIASAVYELVFGGALTINLGIVAVGMIAAFISGIIAIKFMLKLVKNANFIPFIAYLSLLALILSIIYF